MGLPYGSGLFDELYRSMMDEVDRDRRREADYGTAVDMTAEEKRISFLNRYFVYRKMRNVNAEKVGKVMMRRDDEGEEGAEGEDGKEDESKSKESTASVISATKSTIRKLRGPKVKIVIGNPSVADNSPKANVEEAKELPKEASVVYGKKVVFRPANKP